MQGGHSHHFRVSGLPLPSTGGAPGTCSGLEMTPSVGGPATPSAVFHRPLLRSGCWGAGEEQKRAGQFSALHSEAKAPNFRVVSRELRWQAELRKEVSQRLGAGKVPGGLQDGRGQGSRESLSCACTGLASASHSSGSRDSRGPQPPTTPGASQSQRLEAGAPV